LKGKTVLIPFSFTDLTSSIAIGEKHPEFKKTGLKVESSIKLDKIATISKELILGEIGEVGPKLKKEINEKLSKTFTF